MGERSGRRPTLEDVAAKAGVSRALVSIVMRGVAGASAQTRERVMAIADEMGYRPDARARLLAATASPPLLGAVFSAMGTFHFEVLDGLYAAAESVGSHLILSALTTGRDERRAVETLLDFRCDAVILLGPEGAAPTIAGRVPLVVVGWSIANPAVDVVRSSDSLGARQAVDHLVELGHTRIAHLDGGTKPVAQARRRGYRAAMRRHGLQAHLREVPGGWNQEDGVAAARRLLNEPDLPTAILAYNDDVAIGAWDTLQAAGLSVPRDVSIIGWNDSSLAALPYHPLTSVRQDVPTLTRLAVQRGVARAAGTPASPREVVVDTTLTVRASTCAPSTEQSVVALRTVVGGQ